ncbi:MULTISPECIES: cyclic-di-AMP-binding protein CbpB [Enterococcus]|uniref:cyclic-di-AMP-binding protein CbpB n=1 Tax=Enterococcus TaxID=1350 RepID=UPI0010F6BD71|nr:MULTISPECIES: cyclic-di-AMP-binding protein CbpB [Enterococcus]KAF1301163.1 CBS domain-containing protein [Enterococcus sp. JM9B]
MIGQTVKELLLEKQDTFVVPADNVANLMYANPLDHALLVLSKVGYSKIPVLDKEDHFVGLIGLNDIVGKMIDLTKIDTDNLSGMTVADVMEVNVTCIREDSPLEDILHLLVDNSFLPMVDDENRFVGIITRKEILKSVNHLAHEIERRYELVPKVAKESEGLKVI